MSFQIQLASKPLRQNKFRVVELMRPLGQSGKNSLKFKNFNHLSNKSIVWLRMYMISIPSDSETLH